MIYLYLKYFVDFPFCRFPLLITYKHLCKNRIVLVQFQMLSCVHKAHRLLVGLVVRDLDVRSINVIVACWMSSEGRFRYYFVVRTWLLIENRIASSS